MTEFAGFARGASDGGPPTDFDWGVRTHVYGAFARTGEAPSLEDLAALTGAPPGRVRAALETLQRAHQLALQPSGEVWMAHPFSATPTRYSVETPDFTCWASCAWDALGVPAVLGTDASIETECAGSGEPLEFGVERGKVVGDGETVIHLLTPLRDAWDDIGFT
jgi:hypothetical protein